MMRTINFRGKQVDNGEWVYGSYVACWQHNYDSEPNIVHQICDSDGDSFNIFLETVGQFTGLFDMNGKEIFEGDIVMWGHANDYSREFPYRQAVVKLFPSLLFETVTKTEFGTPHKFHYGNFSYKDTHKHLEIIGNIHDNIELLKTE